MFPTVGPLSSPSVVPGIPEHLGPYPRPKIRPQGPGPPFQRLGTSRGRTGRSRRRTQMTTSLLTDPNPLPSGTKIGPPSTTSGRGSHPPGPFNTHPSSVQFLPGQESVTRGPTGTPTDNGHFHLTTRPGDVRKFLEGRDPRYVSSHHVHYVPSPRSTRDPYVPRNVGAGAGGGSQTPEEGEGSRRLTHHQ